MVNSIIKFFLDYKPASWLLLLLFVGWGLVTAPFDWNIKLLPRDAVPVDAIPNIGENQQIVFTAWAGRSPQDIEDQITYPLTTTLLGIPGVKSVRSNSMFGFSSIYLIFEDDIEFYWSRSRILEKLNSLPLNLLPEGIKPALGPDATALGQIFWYTLEGRDNNGEPTGGWDLHELRSIQDYYVRYGLSATSGVVEVASIGGYVQEYQVDVNPDKMRIYGISLQQVMKALKESNLDIGAQTLEINLAEYFVRGLGYVKSIEDIENTGVISKDNVPILIKDIATVNLGPAARRGILDKSGAEVVGGVVVARYGANPLEVINNVKSKIAEIAPGLPSKELEDGTVSKVTIIPFYDRTELINETLGTLEEALTLEILITILVIILLLLNVKASLLVAGSLPIAVLMCFIAMRYAGVEANIVALSGIAIAIGTMVDMGIVLVESMVNRLKAAPPNQTIKETIYLATAEVASAVITAVATTVVSFLPVFTMEAAEGKMFRPLAYTKTFALIASIIVAIMIIPPIATIIFRSKSWSWSKILKFFNYIALIIPGVWLLLTSSYILIGYMAIVVGLLSWISQRIESKGNISHIKYFDWVKNIIYALFIAWILTKTWMPLGVVKSSLSNYLFVLIIIGLLIGFFYFLIYFYEKILRFLLQIKLLFLTFVLGVILLGFSIMSNIGREFMPALDEGAFLLMPSSMPHAGLEVNATNLRLLDMAVTSIPEVDIVVGKAGRVESPLDPAPLSMFENVILYKSEYATDKDGHRIRFKIDKDHHYLLKSGKSIAADEAVNIGITGSDLIPDKKGIYFRQWRSHIHSNDDIWNEIAKVSNIPGVTPVSKLQPIETRLIMLQTGMRARMGIKVKGADLKTIQAFGLEIEKFLKEVDGVKAPAVFAERIVGKPYLLLDINRERIARYGLSIAQVQQQIQATIGGMVMTKTVEGRERYGIRIRYPRELRDTPDKLLQIYLNTPSGSQIPLGEVVKIKYEQGPQAIKSEDGFLVGYVFFDKESAESEVEVVQAAQEYLKSKIKAGKLVVPPGINYHFTGSYEQQVRSNERLALVIPITLIIIFLILYFHFNSVITSLMVFSGVFVAFSGGFIMLWLYGQPWFLDFHFFGIDMRDLFQVSPINLSVAVWVGFLALFGIATDDGVLVATFLKDSFKNNQPKSIEAIRNAVIEGGLRRVRPAMITTATTILALLPILTSTGRGADIMLPMAIPSFGGMLLQVITMFTVPVLYALWKETSFKFSKKI